MFNSLTLLRLVCSHDRHIQEPLLILHLDHMHRGPWDSSHHWAWLWPELLRSLEMLVWLFIWRHALCHILFLLIFTHMSIAYIIICRGMILSVVRHSIMRYRTWLIQGWSTCLSQVWPPISYLRLHMQFLLLLVFSRLIRILMVLMTYGILRYSGLRTRFSRHGYITLQQFNSESFSFWLWSPSESFLFCWV